MQNLKLSSKINLTVSLKERPTGQPNTDCFKFQEEAFHSPTDGKLAYQTLFLSVDPYLRGRMNAGKSYVPPFQVGSPIESGFVGKIIEVGNSDFKVGDLVTGMGPWQRYVATIGQGLTKLPALDIPPSYYLGLLGMPGLTAYFGLVHIGKVKSGDTVVVSAASGAVGSVVIQLAKIRGARAIGIAGSQEKTDYVTHVLGADGCINYREEKLGERLAELCPNGVDVYFDNVGGSILEAVMQCLNDYSRIALCGMISEYNESSPPPGPNLRPLLVHKASIQGFIVSDHFDQLPRYLEEAVPLIKSGRLKYRENTIEGLRQAPQALIDLLKGKNFGKQIVKVED